MFGVQTINYNGNKKEIIYILSSFLVLYHFGNNLYIEKTSHLLPLEKKFIYRTSFYYFIFFRAKIFVCLQY